MRNIVSVVFAAVMLLAVSPNNAAKERNESSTPSSGVEEEYEYYDEDNSCVGIQECEHISWLMKNKDEIPGQTGSSIANIVSNMECGSEKVICLTSDADYFIDEEEQSANASSVAASCQGTLNLVLLAIDLAPSITFRSTAAKTQDVRELLGIRTQDSVTQARIRLDGNCCWEGFPETNFKGTKMLLKPQGKATKPDFELRSVDC